MNQQILFTSEDQSQQSFVNFYPARNQNVITALEDFISQKNTFGCVYLYGESGSGKTHLLHSTANAIKQDSIYFNGQIQSDDLSCLINKTEIALLALDNIEYFANQRADLMMLYESFKQRCGKLIIASRRPPRAIDMGLDDLNSRFISGQVFELKPLDDSSKIQALKYRARLRGFDLSDEVVSYVISRYPRNLKTLFNLLNELDNASLSNKRKITVPLIKQLES